MSETPDPFDHPGYRAAIVDLLGLLAYGELSGFFRMAADAELAPTIHVKAQAAAMAIREWGRSGRGDGAVPGDLLGVP